MNILYKKHDNLYKFTKIRVFIYEIKTASKLLCWLKVIDNIRFEMDCCM